MEVGSLVVVVNARKRRQSVANGDVGVVVRVDDSGFSSVKHSLPWRVRFLRTMNEIWVFRDEVEEVK